MANDVTLSYLVTAGEMHMAGPISFLRRAVAIMTGDRVHFGRVRVVDYDELTINYDGEQIIASVDEVSTVPPIVAL